MKNLIYVELFKTFAKPRTYIGIIAIIILIGLIQLGYYLNREDLGGSIKWMMNDNGVSVENLSLNGNMICYMVLQMLYVHLPIIVALVSGDSISGEMSAGTIRALMVKPAPRWKIFLAKWLANQIYLLLVIIVIYVFGLLISRLLFGNGDMIVYGDEISVLEKSELLFRFTKSIALSYLSLTVISNLAFLLSSYMENSVAPIVITMVVNIVFLIFGSLTFEIFEPIQKVLFTKHMSLWTYSFELNPKLNELYKSIGILLAYIGGFFVLAFYSFTKKDITQ
jgi:ABC-2 type transport system permease protein